MTAQTLTKAPIFTVQFNENSPIQGSVQVDLTSRATLLNTQCFEVLFFNVTPALLEQLHPVQRAYYQTTNKLMVPKSWFNA